MNTRLVSILVAASMIAPCYCAKKKAPARSKVKRVEYVYNPLRIEIRKSDFNLYVIHDSGDTVMKTKVGLGSNAGQKTKQGDRCTPHGEFLITSVEDAHKWTHDFKDGKGVVKGAYGPWFMRLSVPKFPSIGIHGTHAPESIGTRCSEGCIRLHNDDIVRLKLLATPGMRVKIYSEREAPVPDI